MRRRWLMLVLGTAAQTAACLFVYGIPYLAPDLLGAGLSLARIGVLVACPTAGLLLTLVAWGAAADRYGERVVISLGLALGAVFLACAVPVHSLAGLGALFALAGAAGASVFAASGRLVLGWFPARERGLAMGLRQTATPLGMGLAALLVPGMAERYGYTGAVVFFAVALGVTALAVGALVADPPRTGQAGNGREAGHAPQAGDERETLDGRKVPGGREADGRNVDGGTGRKAAPSGGNPYRRPTLWRIHGSSALLVVPQFTVGAFAIVFLVEVRGWDPVDAGRLLAGAQALGALSRIAAGRWSDRIVRRSAQLGEHRQYVGRLRPMRWLAVVTSGVVAVVAVCAVWPSWFSSVVLVVACAITASTNGLAYTAAAELAGPAWTGRVLGAQNTGQNLLASLSPPFAGALISEMGYPQAYAAAALLAAAAAFVVPVPRHAGRGGTRQGTGTGGDGTARAEPGTGKAPPAPRHLGSPIGGAERTVAS